MSLAEQYCSVCNVHLSKCKGHKAKTRTLHGDTSGVCYNCLNGFHKGCDHDHCKCAMNNHKEWWWKSNSEIKKEEVIKAWKWIRENNNSIPDEILDLMKSAAIEKIDTP